MRTSEAIPIAYFVYLAVICWLRPVSNRRRIEISSVSLLTIAGILLVARIAPRSIRDWAPAVSILIGYFLPGRFFERPAEAVERWLASWDRRLLGDPTTRFASWPRALLVYLDVVYMGCFLMLPAGFAALAWTGHAAAADHYWTLVAAADLAAFLSLTIFQTRPPWALERPPELADRSVHRAALLFVRHGTIGANTFPSGHTAVSLAIAFALLPVLPAAAAVGFVLAATIAVACVVGRYHYVMDVFTGIALALVVCATVAALGL
ncbi:MAG TPA: phosphatase PAP2 family protein [Vicinamibacterales bacterium]